MKSRFLFASFFIMPIALSAPSAQAQSYSVTAVADQDTHTGPTFASASANYYHSYPGGDGTYPNVVSGNVSVIGQQGLLTGAVRSSTSEFATSLDVAKANWTDSLTVTSSSLAFGTPISITFLTSYQASISDEVDDFLGKGGATSAQTNLNFDSEVTDAATGKAASLVFAATDRSPQSFGGIGFPTQRAYDMSLQATLNTTVGATINLSSLVDMEASGGVGGGGFKVSTQATINNFSSAVFVNTPADVSLISASGRSYAATPEPAALPVFAVGISIIMFSLRRRKNNRTIALS